MTNRTLSLAVLGLTDIEQRVIKSVCAITASRPVNYRVLDQVDRKNIPDLYLVNAEVQWAVEIWTALRKEHDLPTVLFAKDPVDLKGFFVKRPLVPAILLKVLEQIARIEPLQIQQHDAVTLLPSVHRFKALVVDDSPTVRAQLELVLAKVGGGVVSVGTGESALRALAQEDFDMVFLDVVLPGADGYAVCRTIKKTRGTRHLPVIMLTSKSSPFDKIRGSLAGCDSYLTKPVERQLFRITIQKYIPNHGAFIDSLNH